jgi:anti-anti-sigma factor
MPRNLLTEIRKRYEHWAQEEMDQGRDVTFDFAHCVYVDSSSLGTLVSLRKYAGYRGRTFTLVNLTGDLAHLFAITKLDTLFPVESAA